MENNEMKTIKNNEFQEMLKNGVIFSPLALAQEKKDIERTLMGKIDLEFYNQLKKKGFNFGIDIEINRVSHETIVRHDTIYWSCWIEMKLLKYRKKGAWINQQPKILISKGSENYRETINFNRLFTWWNDTLKLRFIDGLAWCIELFLRDVSKVINEYKSKEELRETKKQARKIAKIMQKLNNGL